MFSIVKMWSGAFKECYQAFQQQKNGWEGGKGWEKKNELVAQNMATIEDMKYRNSLDFFYSVVLPSMFGLDW